VRGGADAPATALGARERTGDFRLLGQDTPVGVGDEVTGQALVGQLAGLRDLHRDDIIGEFRDLLLVEPLPDWRIVTVHFLHKVEEFALADGIDDWFECIEQWLQVLLSLVDSAYMYDRHREDQLTV